MCAVLIIMTSTPIVIVLLASAFDNDLMLRQMLLLCEMISDMFFMFYNMYLLSFQSLTYYQGLLELDKRGVFCVLFSLLSVLCSLFSVVSSLVFCSLFFGVSTKKATFLQLLVRAAIVYVALTISDCRMLFFVFTGQVVNILGLAAGLYEVTFLAMFQIAYPLLLLILGK